LTGLRRRYPALRHTRWFHGQPTHERKLGYRAGCDIAWLGPNGQPLTDEAWEDSAQSSFACVIEVAEVPDKHAQASERVMLLFNAGLHVLPFVLPPGPWRLALDSAAAQVDAGPLTPAGPTISGVCDLSATTLRLLVQAIESDPAGNCAAASISAADFQQAAP
jgi:glycogen operon protein